MRTLKGKLTNLDKPQFSGFLAQPAAYSFINRFMSNHSAEKPEGFLEHNVLKSFYAVEGDRNNFTYTQGHEVCDRLLLTNAHEALAHYELS